MSWETTTIDSEAYSVMMYVSDAGFLQQFSVPLNPIDRSIVQEYSISGKTYTPKYVHNIKKANYEIKASYLQTMGNERSLMREFWRLRKRNAKGFYLPSWNKDYKVVSYVHGTKTVTVKNAFYSQWGGVLNTRYLLIFPNGNIETGSYIFTRVTDNTDNTLVLQTGDSGIGSSSIIMNLYFVHFVDAPLQIKSEGTHAYSTIEFAFQEDQGDRA